MSAIEIVRPNALPIAPRVGTVEIDLYIEKPVVCGTDTPTTFCVVGDNRPHAPEGGPDPQADPSRNRVEGILDFTTGTVTFRVNPSCSVPTGVGQDVCFAPHPDGQGNNVSITRPSPSSSEIDTTWTESANPVGGFLGCTIREDLTFTPNNATGDLDISGKGTRFPSVAVIHNGKVIIGPQGVNASALCAYPHFSQDYRYTGARPGSSPPPPTPQISTSTAPTSTPATTPAPSPPTSGQLCSPTPCKAQSPDGVTVTVDRVQRYPEADGSGTGTLLHLRWANGGQSASELIMDVDFELVSTTGDTSHSTNNEDASSSNCPGSGVQRDYVVSPGQYFTGTLCYGSFNGTPAGLVFPTTGTGDYLMPLTH